MTQIESPRVPRSQPINVPPPSVIRVALQPIHVYFFSGHATSDRCSLQMEQHARRRSYSCDATAINFRLRWRSLGRRPPSARRRRHRDAPIAASYLPRHGTERNGFAPFAFANGSAKGPQPEATRATIECSLKSISSQAAILISRPRTMTSSAAIRRARVAIASGCSRRQAQARNLGISASRLLPHGGSDRGGLERFRPASMFHH
jgi:hypothetical protein